MNKEICCGKCGTSQGELILMSKSKNTFYHYCRKCNTEKHRKFSSTAKGRLSIRLSLKKTYYKNHVKALARGKVSYAIASGKLIRPKDCQICGAKEKLQAHHSDYSKPLDVTWVCINCHCILDKQMLT